MTFDAGFNRSGYWWPDYAWTDDVRQTDLTTTHTRGAFLELHREPVRWGYNGTWSWFTNINNMNHEIKSGFLGYTQHRTTSRPTAIPNQQIYQYRSLPGDTDLFLRPDSVQVFDYPNDTNGGVNFNSWFVNDMITLTPQLTLNAGVRFDRYGVVAARTGQSRHRPVCHAEHLSGESRLPVLQRVVAAPVADLRPDRQRPRRAQSELWTLRGVGLRCDCGERAGGQQRQPGRDADVHLSLERHDSLHAEPGRSDSRSAAAARGDARARSRTSSRRAWTNTPAVSISGLTRDLTVRFNVVRKLDWGGSKELDLAHAVRGVHRLSHRHRSRAATTSSARPTTASSRCGRCRAPIRRSGRSTGSRPTRSRTKARTSTGRSRPRPASGYSNGLVAARRRTRWDRRDVRNNTPLNPNQARYNWELPQSPSGRTAERHARSAVGFACSPRRSPAQEGEYFSRVVQVRNALNTLST